MKSLVIKEYRGGQLFGLVLTAFVVVMAFMYKRMPEYPLESSIEFVGLIAGMILGLKMLTPQFLPIRFNNLVAVLSIVIIAAILLIPLKPGMDKDDATMYIVTAYFLVPCYIFLLLPIVVNFLGLDIHEE